MNKQKPGSSIGSLLNRPHLDAAPTDALPPDPSRPTRVFATLDQVIAYEDDPRKSKNPLYDEIKASIRNRGLDHAPNVTRKNPADPYMIKDGGNTRLRILRELWEETADERFYRFELMFHPYSSKLDMMIGHAVENEMRGAMLFIERALHAKRIREELLQTEGKALTIAALAKRLSSEGWSVNESNLNQMLYAEETLLPVIPEAFWSGVGIDRVKKIRKLLEACRTYWEAVRTPQEPEFSELWIPVFKELDGNGFDVSAAEYSLCGAMAKRLDGPVLSITPQIQSIMEGVKDLELLRPEHFNPIKAVPPTAKSSSKPKASPPRTDTGTPQSSPPNSSTGGSNELASKLMPDDGQSPFEPVSTLQPHFMDDALGGRKYSISEIPGGTPLLYGEYPSHSTSYLQQRAHEIALTYARRFGIANNIVSMHDVKDPEAKHMGFYVSADGLNEMPAPLRIHWVLLSSFAFLRHENRTRLLLETMASAFNGELDTLMVADLLLSVNHARTMVLGECARNEHQSLKPVWEEITELEAIASILITRTFEESQLIDAIPDESFLGVVRETGSNE